MFFFKRVRGPLRSDKLFRIHFESLLGQTLISYGNIFFKWTSCKKIYIDKNNAVVKYLNANLRYSTPSIKSQHNLPVNLIKKLRYYQRFTRPRIYIKLLHNYYIYYN